MKCIDYLTPITCHKRVLVVNGSIEIDGHRIKDRLLQSYDHQTVTVNEYKDCYCIFTDEGRLIIRLAKNI